MDHLFQAGPQSFPKKKLVVTSTSSLTTPRSPQSLIPVPKAMSCWNGSDPGCNTSCFFLTLGNQARAPYPLTYHCARPLGAVRGRIRHGERTQASGTLQSGSEKKEVSAGTTAPVTEFSAPCHEPGAPCRNANPPERNVLSSTSAAASPKDTRSGQEIPVSQGRIQSWVSRKTGTKAELLSKTEQSRPNATGAGLLPDPEVLLSLPWGKGQWGSGHDEERNWE